MNKARTKNTEVYLDRSESRTSTPLRGDDGVLNGDAKPVTGTSPSVAVAVNDSITQSSTPPNPGRKEHQVSSATAQQLSARNDHRPRERIIGKSSSSSPGREKLSPGEAADRGMGNVERDAAHFKMVAAQFRALMERRERRLEEAMSDPQTRTDLEAMFPGIRDGDYQTLLAGVRGMEEDDFQALLVGARKHRHENHHHHQQQQQSERGVENKGDERRSTKSSGPAGPAPPETIVRECGGIERRENNFPPPGHQPAFPNQQRYYYDDRDDPFPHYTGPGARRMSGGEMSHGRAEGGGDRDGIRREAEGRDGRGLPPMWSRDGDHQLYSSSSRSVPRDPGGHMASASPAAGCSGKVDETGTIRRVGGNDLREPYYHHPDRKLNVHEEGERQDRGMLPLPPTPLRAPYDDRMPPPSIGRSGTSVPVVGGVGDGVHKSYAHLPSHDREVPPSCGFHPSGAADHRPSPDHKADIAPCYARPRASAHHTARDDVSRIVQSRDSRRGEDTAFPVIACGPAAALPVAYGIGRDIYGETRTEETRTPTPDAKSVAARLCELVKRCGGNLDKIMADPGKIELESIFPGLEKEFRAMLRGCVERPQPPSFYHKPEEQAQHDVDRPYRRENARLSSEREVPYSHRGGEPEHPRYPPTHEHGYPEMGYSYREGREHYLSQEDRYYREPREAYPRPRVGSYVEHGWDRNGDKDGGGSNADFMRAKCEVSDDPYPKYSPTARVHGKPSVEMAIGRGGDNSKPSLTHSALESSRSPEGLRPHPLPILPSYPPLYQPPVRPEDHNTPSTPPSQHRRPSDPADLILPRRESPLQQHTHPQPPQSKSQTPQRSESTAAHRPASEHRDFRRESPGTRDDLGGNGGPMVDHHPPIMSASSEDPASSVREVTPIDEGLEPFCEVVRDSTGMTRLYIPEHPPVVPRRPPSKGNKRETLNDIAHRIPVSVMRPYFNYPLRKAAEAMNISVTTLKRLCRRHGVKRWPHRQISGINRAMAHLEFQQDQAGRRHGTGQINTQVSEQMQELLRRRRVMIEHAFESDDSGNRSQGRNSLDSDEEVMDSETYMAGEGMEPQIAEGMEDSTVVNDQHSSSVTHARASPLSVKRGRSASPHEGSRAPVRQMLPPPSSPPGSPSGRPASPSTPSKRVNEMSASSPPIPQQQLEDHDAQRHVFQHELGGDGTEEGERYHQQQREHERNIRRSERLVGPRSGPHGRGDNEIILKEDGEMVAERRELRPLPRRGREQEDAQSLKYKQRGPPEEALPAKRQTPRSHPFKAEPPMQPKALRPGQKPPSPLTCGPRVPPRS